MATTVTFQFDGYFLAPEVNKMPSHTGSQTIRTRFRCLSSEHVITGSILQTVLCVILVILCRYARHPLHRI